MFVVLAAYFRKCGVSWCDLYCRMKVEDTVGTRRDHSVGFAIAGKMTSAALLCFLSHRVSIYKMESATEYIHQ